MNPNARLSFAVAALLAVASFGFTPAHAGYPEISVEAPLFLSWNSCHGSPGAAGNLSYACDGSLDGNPRHLVVSFQLPTNYPPFTWESSTIYLKARTLDGSALPDYWRIEGIHVPFLLPALCRPGLGLVESGAGVVDPNHCPSWWQNRTAFDGIARPDRNELADPATNDMTIEGAMFWSDVDGGRGAVTFPAGTRLSDGAFTLELASNGCGGCDQPMSIEIVRLDLDTNAITTSGAYPHYILTPGSGSSASVTWQGGGGGTVPVRNRTWGSVKATYR